MKVNKSYENDMKDMKTSIIICQKPKNRAKNDLISVW